jgi:hypothetical protein
VSTPAFISEARRSFHAALLGSVLTVDDRGVWSNADRASNPSKEIAQGIAEKLGEESHGARLAGQMAGRRFEEICREFLEETFLKLGHLRPGSWRVERTGSLAIAAYDQYAHLRDLEAMAKADELLAAALGSGYLIKPDVVIAREPEEDEKINQPDTLFDESYARLSSLRKLNGGSDLLHASISCKWTIRSDRAQNARSEALNLMRNRKGRVPHIVVVTAEPLPGRIASLALGTGDIDCVYHFALDEMWETVGELAAGNSAHEHAEDQLRIMAGGRRLRDIADLPLDLAV